MKEIFLTQNKIALVDDDDFEWLSKFTWCSSYMKKSGLFYAITGSHNRDFLGSTLMHRAIMKPDKTMQVDHIDHNTLNNQKNNLRICSNHENHKNIRLQKNNKSGICGVYFYPKRNKYAAYIQVNGKSKFIGHFDNIDDASSARKLAEIQFNFHANHGGVF